MSTHPDDELDGLIDSTARELTLGSPSAALRESVRARLSARRAWWQVPIWQPALGAAALAVLAVALMVPDRQVPAVPAAPETRASAPGVDEPPPMVARGLPASADGSGEAGRSASPRPQPSGSEPQAAASNQVTVPEDPLPPIEPLEIEPVPIERAVIEEIAAPMPLSIDRLQIERLSLE